MTTLVQHPLGAMLASRRLMPLREVESCLQRAREEDRDLEEILVGERRFSPQQLLEILENQTFCPAIDVSDVEVPADLLALVPREIAVRNRAVPLALVGERLQVAMATPDDAERVRAVSRASRRELVPHVGLGFQIDAALARLYREFDTELDELLRSDERPRSDAPVPPASSPSRARPAASRELTLNPHLGSAMEGIEKRNPAELLDELLREAIRTGATDLHLQPQEEGLYVRLRIDGVLQNVARIPIERAPSVISRLKILANLDISEHRRPQDGRARFEFEDQVVDLRLSCMPSQWGTKAVVRLLRRSLELLDVDRLRMPTAVREAFQEAIESPLGFYLVTGPTGSGKTTTLYATLQALDRGTTNISTLEDPIEYSLPGITQVQTHEEIGFGFAEGLRSLLRQDPDVILVGEIRDVETVEVACRAALTGHKVFSTLHTNDACQAITRLLDMGAPPHLISATLRGVLAQRLVRVICDHCKEAVEMTDLDRMLLGYPTETVMHRGRGCLHCGGSGYRGRTAIFEYFHMDETMHRLVQDRASPFAIRHAAQRAGMLLMSDFARRAVLDGVTTVAEIQRTILAEEGREQLCHGCKRTVDVEFSVCPFCHATLKESCPGCGRSVEANWEACAHCGESLEHEWQKLFCRSCLAPVQPSWRHCEYCNAELQT